MGNEKELFCRMENLAMLWKKGSSKMHSIYARGGGGGDKYERNLTLLVESEVFILFFCSINGLTWSLRLTS